MAPTIVAAPDEWTVSLPLKTARSAVFWPRRMATERRLGAALAAVPSLGEAERVCALATAVICVLHRYGADVAAIGLAGGDGRPRLLAIASSAADTIGALHDLIAGALRNGTLPQVANSEPETAYNPIIPVLLASDGDVDALPELRQDLNLAIDSAGIGLRCSYGSRLFDAQTVNAFLGHVIAYLAAQLSDPTQTIGSIHYVDAGETARIDAAGRPNFDLPAPAVTVQALFADAAASRPDAVAIEADGTTLSYHELDMLTGRIAAGLLAGGVVGGDLVAISMRPGIKQIAGVIGILKARATPVPIDYTFPLARIRGILAIAAPKAVLTDGVLSAAGVATARWLEVDALVAANPAPTVSAVGQLDDLVYVLFTSGSTGTPKGVAMRQRTLVNLVQWQCIASGEAGARTLNRSSIAFDVGFQEVFATLCFGRTLVVASEAERADVVGLAPFIERRRVNRIFIPPVSLIQMAEAMDEKATPLSALRHVIVAGEAMRITPAIIRMFRTCSARVTNQYGPTETHVATSFDLQGPSLRWPQLPPIGRPIANARVHVLDSAGQRCPVGVRGEIAVGGLLPAWGYLGQAGETDKRFIPDPFADDPAGDAVMYLTGDFGRLTSDGNFEFLGRRDDQVKLRGYRIELGDIEANAMSVPGVKTAAAVLREREQSGPYIALFVEPQADAMLDARRIREHLAAHLPAHMVPSLGAIAILPRMPLNRNGKVDRKRLPETVEHTADPGEGGGGTLDTQIEAIWRRYLNVGDIRRDDEFMALGGHSLMAIQIASRINDRYGIAVPVATLLRGGSFGRFIDTVSNHIEMKSNSAAALPRPADRQTPATLYQVRLADGRMVVAPYPEEAHHYHREIVERGVYLRHGIGLAEDDVVVDVGANIGLFSLAVLSRHPGCRVIAAEPAPLLAAALKQNLADANGNATLLEIGFSDRDGEREFTFYPNVTGMSSFVPDAAADRALLAGLIANARSANLDVDRSLAGNESRHLDARLVSERLMRPVQRLSTVIGRLALGRIDLLKIDVQRGSEQVLDGIDAGDWRKIRQIVVEHQHPGGARSAVEERLIGAGYSVTTAQDDIHRGTDVVYTYATRTQ